MALAAATASVALAAPVSAQPAAHADTQALLDTYQANGGPGAAVYAGNRTGTWELHKGINSTISTRPIQAGDQFRAASQTKTFVAAVVLQLVDEGRIVLDEPIETYLPGVVQGNGYDGNAITVRQLLRHTSGIARDVSGAQRDPDGTFRLAELVRAGLTQPPLFAPGTGWSYSNVGYHVLGMLIEQVTGTSAADAVNTRIVQPLGLTRTKYPAAAETGLEAPYAHGYSGGRLGPFYFWTDVTIADTTPWATAGAVVSTEEELAEFMQALADGRVMSAAARAEMRATVPSDLGDGLSYGLGLIRMDLTCGGAAWGHAGTVPGYSSATFATDDGRRAAVVTNTFVTGEHANDRWKVVDSALCDTPVA
ncbi:serine hydrolase domain-containing protein [Amycolatopsis endophytica]